MRDQRAARVKMHTDSNKVAIEHCKHRPFKIGLAVSGGADSTALLALMAGLQLEHGFRAVVLHVDHGLRSDSADDARYVAGLAAAHRLPLASTRVRVRRRPGESIEMAARRVRLAFFERQTRELGLDAIATGHHADDVAETFLMRLARGSGADGLAGLKPISRVGSVTFIRPLLGVRHEEIKAFLRRAGIAWREDSTNSDVSIMRNRVRHVVIPFLRENLDPRITEHICKSAAILRGDLERPQAASAPPPKRARAVDAPRFTLEVAPDTGFLRPPPTPVGALPASAWMSRAALAGRTLEVRAWKAGDRIAPTGMGGRSRKLQDVFVTAKTPPEIRNTLPVVADAASGEVLWVPGYRVGCPVAVESPGSPSWRLTLAMDSVRRPRGEDLGKEQ